MGYGIVVKNIRKNILYNITITQYKFLTVIPYPILSVVNIESFTGPQT
jgi:hypothetical protein